MLLYARLYVDSHLKLNSQLFRLAYIICVKSARDACSECTPPNRMNNAQIFCHSCIAF